MAHWNVILLRETGRLIEGKVSEAVAYEIKGHFLNTPNPFKQEYDALFGTALEGYQEGHIAIDWHADWNAIIIYPQALPIP
jgi:hypothetical protein